MFAGRRFLVWGLEGLAEIAREAVRRARASERDPIALALIGSLPDAAASATCPTTAPSAHGGRDRDSSGAHSGDSGSGSSAAAAVDEMDGANNPYADIVLKLTGCLLNGLKVLLNITQENGALARVRCSRYILILTQFKSLRVSFVLSVHVHVPVPEC